MRFFKMSLEQRKKFEGLKTTDQMRQHGPLAEGEEVPIHEHDRALYLLSEGEAQYVAADGQATEVLGANQRYDAVVVETGEQHGWMAKTARVVIEHVIGGPQVDMVLAAA